MKSWQPMNDSLRPTPLPERMQDAMAEKVSPIKVTMTKPANKRWVEAEAHQ
jgi:hypothetical protein